MLKVEARWHGDTLVLIFDAMGYFKRNSALIPIFSKLYQISAFKGEIVSFVESRFFGKSQ